MAHLLTDSQTFPWSYSKYPMAEVPRHRGIALAQAPRQRKLFRKALRTKLFLIAWGKGGTAMLFIALLLWSLFLLGLYLSIRLVFLGFEE